ncbi:hypothetical protein PoB_002083600 [Plakobranchus ocellatus]|uniref:Uncharacterized protein n=1 Tax=Plakobranchus ocellatus TaxID=259542 RepID=A0AAV3ZI72_9GAST|nr:hypothetical protein PoB_002083600 [Plakobranchus ocellatus]
MLSTITDGVRDAQRFHFISHVRRLQVDRCVADPYEPAAFTSQLTFLDLFLAHHNTFTSCVSYYVDFSTTCLPSQGRHMSSLVFFRSLSSAQFVTTGKAFRLTTWNIPSLIYLWRLSVQPGAL